MYAGDSIPNNYMLCDGRELSKTEYPQLFNAVGTIYGESADTLSFKIPDLRGCFTRCVGGNASALGVKQGDAIRNIVGTADGLRRNLSGGYSGIDAFRLASGGWTGDSNNGGTDWLRLTFDASRVVPTAEENRPINMALSYAIQVR